MRITDGIIVSTMLQNLQDTENRIGTIDNQLTSGQQLSQISDNPAQASRILGLQSTIALNGQYQRNATGAAAWLGATDAALSGVSEVMARAQELAVEAANDSQSGTDRQDLASEVNSLIAQVAQDGNATYEGNYIFAGAQTDTAPFTAGTGSVTYNNSDPVSATKLLTREIAPGTTVAVNTLGHDPTGGTGVFDQVFSALTGLYTALQNNSTSAIQTSITQLSTSQGALSQTRAVVGGTMDQVNTTQQQLTLLGTHLDQYRSTLQDADLAQAATDFATANNVRQASLSAMAKSFPPSLFSYLT